MILMRGLTDLYGLFLRKECKLFHIINLRGEDLMVTTGELVTFEETFRA